MMRLSGRIEKADCKAENGHPKKDDPDGPWGIELGLRSDGN
jgi:hypothetical protein